MFGDVSKAMDAFGQMQEIMQKLDAAKLKELETKAREFFERAERIEKKLDAILKACEESNDGDGCDGAGDTGGSEASGS